MNPKFSVRFFLENIYTKYIRIHKYQTCELSNPLAAIRSTLPTTELPRL